MEQYSGTVLNSMVDQCGKRLVEEWDSETVWWNNRPVEQCWNSVVEQRRSMEKCGGTLKLWNSMVKQRNSVRSEEQYAGPVEQYNRTVEQCGGTVWNGMKEQWNSIVEKRNSMVEQ